MFLSSGGFKSSLLNGRTKGGKKEKLRTSRWRKEKKDEHLELLTMPLTILNLVPGGSFLF